MKIRHNFTPSIWVKLVTVIYNDFCGGTPGRKMGYRFYLLIILYTQFDNRIEEKGNFWEKSERFVKIGKVEKNE